MTGRDTLLIAPTITVDTIRAVISRVLPETGDSRPRLSCAVFLYIVGELLGKEWVDKHIAIEPLSGAQSAQGFFSFDFSDEIDGQVKFQRLFELAETLLNLQTVEGFQERILLLRTADKEHAEALFAELQLASILYEQCVSFRFVVPQRKLGSDHDFEIVRKDGKIVCADAKCKLETTAIAAKSVLDSLRTGRTQLPDNAPGIIFVKIPQNWFKSGKIGPDLQDITRRFLSGTRRVTSIVYYTVYLELDQNAMHIQHIFQEVPNTAHRFENLDWTIFGEVREICEIRNRNPNWVNLMLTIEDFARLGPLPVPRERS